MNLTALPAFTDHPIWMFDDGARPIVCPGERLPALRVSTPAAARWPRF